MGNILKKSRFFKIFPIFQGQKFIKDVWKIFFAYCPKFCYSLNVRNKFF